MSRGMLQCESALEVFRQYVPAAGNLCNVERTNIVFLQGVELQESI